MAGQQGARLYLVGELRVDAGGAVLRGPALASRKGRTALTYLALDPGRTCTAADLAAVLWPDGPPDTAPATVASLVSRLRRTVAGDLIAGSRSGYRLAPHVDVDLVRAEALVVEAERRWEHPGLAAAAAGTALDVLRGTALPDAGDSDWAERGRATHAALRRRARLAAVRARTAIGDHPAALDTARSAAAEDPLDEDAARALMSALAGAGETAAATRVFAELRRRLADELGVDPAPATTALHTAILRTGAAAPALARATVAPSAPLVGRDAEFSALRGLWADAGAGHGNLVLIAGVAGAGKTRLANELAALATATGGTVLEARCYEAERALFLQPLVEAITAAIHSLPPKQIHDAAMQHRDTLARLVPELAGIVDRPAPMPVRADVERRRAAEAVGGLLAGLARSAPVLVVLDDLHNAGTSTIEVLHFLRTVLPHTRLLVTATIRDVEGAPTMDALAGVARTVPVGALPVDAVRALATAAGQAHRGDEIARRTGGHALFVAEILRAGGAQLPTTLRDAVLARAAQAGTSVEALLRAAAVLGAAFEPRHAAALAGMPLAEGLAVCERALQAGLVRTAGRSYEFSNDLVREVLYATTPAPTRIAYHQSALEQLAGVPEQAAGHATAVEDWDRAARSWLVAGSAALRSFAAADAEALATRALTAADRVPAVELRGRALVLRGRARDVRSDYVGAWDDFHAAADAARDAGDPRLEMDVLRELAGNVPVALGLSPAMNDAPLARCLHLARDLGDRVTEAEMLTRMAVLGVTRLDFLAAADCAEQAMRSARAGSDPDALVVALDGAKTVHAYLGEVQQLAGIVAELEPVLRRRGDLYLLQWTVLESAYGPLAAGDHARAVALIEAALAINRRTGLTPMEAFFQAQLAWALRLSGELDAAAATGARAVDMAREHSHAWWQSTAVSVHASTLLALGRRAEAARLVEQLAPSLDTPGTQSYLLRCLAPLAEATGSRDTLVAATAVLDTLAAPAGSAWLTGADCYLSVARAWRRHGDETRARSVLQPMTAAARRVGWGDLVRLAGDVV